MRPFALPWFVCFALVCDAAGAEFRAGAAAVKITPPKGAPLAGYYYNRAAEGVHDDLYAKALVLQQDTNKVAFVVCDLISLTRPIVEEARKIISEGSGLKGDNVMMSATHTHTAPVLRGGSTRNAAQGGEEDIAARYTAELPKLIAESVRLAEQNLTNASAFAGWGRVENLSFNRRYLMRNGTVGWNPGKLNTNIVRAAGPVDPDIAVFYVQTPDGKKPLSTYVNFAMHPDTVGGVQISADYPFTLAKLLGEYKGPDMVTIFANSTCGNINHVDVNWRDPQKGHPEAARIGTILAGEVLQRYKKLRPIHIGPLRARSEIVKLPLPLVKQEEIEEARRIAQIPAVTGTNQPKFLDRVKAYKVLDVAAREGKPHELEVQVIALGNDVAWVSLPGEIFVEIGLAIKKASPFYYTFIAELANGSIGYIPNREAYAQGNYEVVSARCAEGSGELLLQSAIHQLKELHTER
jgi:neutral/alkaline ceramidase-like enzyme